MRDPQSAEVVIRAQGLGKQYRVGHREASYKTLRESLIQFATGPVVKLGALIGGDHHRREVIGKATHPRTGVLHAPNGVEGVLDAREPEHGRHQQKTRADGAERPEIHLGEDPEQVLLRLGNIRHEAFDQ